MTRAYFPSCLQGINKAQIINVKTTAFSILNLDLDPIRNGLAYVETS
jgi:hypothetical protein